MMFHFISVFATRNCGFSERTGDPHNLCSNPLIHCIMAVDPKTPATADWIVLNLTNFTSAHQRTWKIKLIKLLWSGQKASHTISLLLSKEEKLWSGEKKMFASVCGSQDFHNPIVRLVLQSESHHSCSGELERTYIQPLACR